MEIVGDAQAAEQSSLHRYMHSSSSQTPPSHEEKQSVNQLEFIGLVHGFAISVTNIQNIVCHTHSKKVRRQAIKKCCTKNDFICSYHIFGIGVINSTLFTRPFLTGMHMCAGHKTTTSIVTSEYVWCQECLECNPQVMNNEVELRILAESHSDVYSVLTIF